MTEPGPEVTIQPLVSWPRQAAPGGSYVVTVDLRLPEVPEEWPYEQEEFIVGCMLDGRPACRVRALGTAGVVLHRFGGTYGPARFIADITDKPEDLVGAALWLTLTTEGGVPFYTGRLPLDGTTVSGVVHDQPGVPLKVEPSAPLPGRTRFVDRDERSDRAAGDDVSVRPPETDSWVAAVHASEDDFEPLGAAVVIDADRVLTCAHVVMAEGAVRDGLWVAFPKADDAARRRVVSVQTAYAPRVRDLAVLVLEEQVPAGVEPTRLRFPKGQDLTGREWRAFGFPDRDPVGDSADGQVGAALSYGWVRLDSGSRYLIRPGFSGGGLWSPDYRAVVGIVGQAHANGDGRAITLYQADLDLPGLGLAALGSWSAEPADEATLAQWGWTLALDPAGVRHWRPRARGVSIDSERGWRFRGRAAALGRIVSWLDRPRPDGRVLVVTGSPGAGKSAVLGRIVTTADPQIRASMPPDDTGLLASVGSVSCAVHAKDKTALEVAEEIARAASARLPSEPEDLAPALRDALDARPRSRFNVIIDALDEVVTPAEARTIIDAVVLPIAETCSDAGAQVAVGTRRRDDGGDLLVRFGSALDLIDLDDPHYFQREDLAAYALASLQLAGDERTDNPYAVNALAIPLADKIAEISAQNFLIAGLIARSYGLHDSQPTSPDRISARATVSSALAAYLSRLAPVADVPAASLLTALAFAEAPGLPAPLWQLAVKTLYQADVTIADLARFARSTAANFLAETSGEAGPGSGHLATGPTFRLFHQALSDALLHDRFDISPRAYDERALTRAFATYGRASDWQSVPEYLLHSLPGHAHAGGLTDELLTDDAYLLYADLDRLLQVADDASSPEATNRARLLRSTPEASTSPPGERAAQFSVIEALDDLGTTYRTRQWRSPYYAVWAAAQSQGERTSSEGRQGAVNAVAAITVEGRDLLASGSDDGSVRLWVPSTVEQAALMPGHEDAVNAVAAITSGVRNLLASGSDDGTVRLWDLSTGEVATVLRGNQEAINALAAITSRGRDLLASGSDDGTVRLWDPSTGEPVSVLRGHRAAVNAIAAVTVGTRDLLATGSDDGTVRLWDPNSGSSRVTVPTHRRPQAIAPAAGSLAIGLDSGILVIRLGALS